MDVIVKRIMWVLVAVALLLSAAHLGLAAMTARAEWTLAVLWFAGSGLALLFAGLLNVLALRVGSDDPVARAVWLLGNLAAAGFFLLAWPLLKQPQVLVGVATFGLLALGVGVMRPGRPG